MDRHESPDATEGNSARRPPRKGGLHYDVSPFRRLIFGHPLETAHQHLARVPKSVALPVFASDAISSSVYATQQIVLVLGAAGLWTMQYRQLYGQLALAITAAILILLAVVVTSYWQTIFAYPSGGGSYIVSSENLGATAGLIAGSALLIDYVLTVAVSIAAGVQNLLAMPVMAQHNFSPVTVSIVCIALLTFANLRGLRESGTFFAFPTYFFILMALLMIGFGIIGPHIGWHIHTEHVNQTIPPEARRQLTVAAGGLALIGVALKGFANGCAALTGTEAISNGVPAFQKPESRNAAVTLVWMAVILGVLFAGISWLVKDLHVVYWERGHVAAMPVIDQLSGAIFGKTAGGVRGLLYGCMQVSTMLVLVLAANTSFADFPRLASLMARDRYLPRQLMSLGDKLVFANGIALLGLLAIALIVKFHGSVDRLIPLYAIGVFTSFTLSQSGMVLHWIRLRSSGWRQKAAINGLGAVFTFVVLLTIAAEKFVEGAWIVIVLMAILCLVLRVIWRHYEYIRSNLTIIGYQRPDAEVHNAVLLLLPSLHRGVLSALGYARSLSPDVRCIHIEIEPEATGRLKAEWEASVGQTTPLVILPSLYRSLAAPVLVYVSEVLEERPNQMVTVVIPEFASRNWWHALLMKFLHNKNGILLRYFLLMRRRVVVTSYRYYLEEGDESGGTRELSPRIREDRR